jgi:hypothetical protein
VGSRACSEASVFPKLMPRFTRFFSICVLVLWFVVTLGTLKKSLSGELSFAPCLQDIRKKEQEALQKEDKRV